MRVEITSRDDDMEEVHREVWYTKDKLKGRSYLRYFLVLSFFVVPSWTLVCKFFDWASAKKQTYYLHRPLLHREWVLLFLSLGWTHICQALVQHSGTAMAPWEQWDLDDTMGFDQEPDLSYHLTYRKYQSINTHPNWAISSSFGTLLPRWLICAAFKAVVSGWKCLVPWLGIENI